MGIIACSTKEPDLTVIGNVKGLKKGTLFLQKQQDSVLVIIDSVKISGDSNFKLQSALEEPEVFFLVLDKNATNQDRIAFFANKGVTEISTTLKNFVFDAKIIGSQQQTILEEYNNMVEKYRNKNLDLIKENFEALSKDDSVKALKTSSDYKSLLKSKYLYTINFALNNKTSQVSPYIALKEAYDAQLKYLDTIYVSLPDSIATSKYGKELKAFIKERKAIEVD